MPAAARKIALTDRAMLALKPVAGKRVTIWDGIQPGMAVQVGAKGRPTFYAVRRRAGDAQPTWRKIGEFPTMSLAEAREAARGAIAVLMAGNDPKLLAKQKRRAEAEAEAERAANTFADVAERFDNWYSTTNGKGGRPRRRAPEVAAIIRRELLPEWGARPITEITERDVTRRIQAILTRGGERPAPGGRRRSGGPYAARHAFAAARLLFGWAHRPPQRLIPVDPTADIKPENLHGEPLVRERVLSDDELPALWRAAETTPYPYGPLVRLLLLTGARLREWAEASWSEINLDAATLTVPTNRMKMKVAHLIPLTPAAIAIVRALPRFNGGDWLFSTTGGRRPISGFSKFRAKFNKTLAAAGARAGAPFTIHDLRRTARTGLSTMSVLPFVAELVIGHQQQGIAAVYDLHRYDAEKRAALEAWERRLLGLVAPEPAPPAKNVVPMRARGRR
jgi:integrase